VTELQAAVGAVPRIYEGCDFHLTFDNIQDALSHPTKYTINHKNYLLVEFSDMLIFQNTAEIFAKMRQAGIVPVITHPERNPLLQQRLPVTVGSGRRVDSSHRAFAIGAFRSESEAVLAGPPETPAGALHRQ
jgi:hypothetical protein